MKNTRFYLVIYAACSGLACATTVAATDSPVQSSARPLGLSLVGEVEKAGSDTPAAAFQKQVLPSIEKLVDVKLSEYHSMNDNAILLDPAKLKLRTASDDVRVYFVGEGAGYHNSLGFNANNLGLNGGTAKLIFPDASSPDSYLNGKTNSVLRTAYEPLLPGDFVDLGKFSAGTNFDFFLIADGANGGGNVWSSTPSQNADNFNHVVSFKTSNDSPYLIVGFEDLWGGGDRDYNDAIFAIDLGKSNVAQLRALTTAPEPALYLTLGSFLAVLIVLKRKTATAAAI